MQKGTRTRMAIAAIACIAASVLAFPALAFAEDGAEASGGITAILPDMMEFIPMLIAFIILWVVLAKFGWPLFNGMLEKREKSIRDALEKSEAAKVESERLLEEHRKQLEEAKTQANQIISDARNTGESMRIEMNKQAQKEAADILEKAKATVAAEKKTAVAEIQSSLVDLTIDVAAKFIGKDLTEGEHRQIIEKYVKEAGSFNGN